MGKDWFPFFSMLFWYATKVAGLVLFLTGLIALGTLLIGGGRDSWFGSLIATVALPFVVGFLLLKTELLFDLGTEEMRRRTGGGEGGGAGRGR